MANIEERLRNLNIELPKNLKARGTYQPARWLGNTIYISGNGPMIEGEVLYSGKLGQELTVEEGYKAARLSMLNILGILKQELGDLDRIERFIKILAFIASTDDFYHQPKVIDGASDLLVEVFGERGLHARSAIGTNVLPFNLPVEIEAIVEIKI